MNVLEFKKATVSSNFLLGSATNSSFWCDFTSVHRYVGLGSKDRFR